MTTESIMKHLPISFGFWWYSKVPNYFATAFHRFDLTINIPDRTEHNTQQKLDILLDRMSRVLTKYKY